MELHEGSWEVDSFDCTKEKKEGKSKYNILVPAKDNDERHKASCDNHNCYNRQPWNQKIVGLTFNPYEVEVT